MKYNKGGIYIIQNIINGKIYLGKSINLGKRKVSHLSSLRNGNHHNKYLQNAWNKYGEDVFRFNVIEYIDDLFLLDAVEQFCLDELLDLNTDISNYNMAEKTHGIGLSKGKHPLFNRKGKYHKDSIRVVKVNSNGDVVCVYDGLSEAARKEGVSEACISECCSGSQKTCKNHAWFKESYFLENRCDIDISKFFTRERSRSVVMCNLENKLVGRFNTIREAAKELNLNEKSIQECCSGRQKTHRGYICYYAENYYL